MFARDNCERGSLDRRVPHHIRRATPLLAVDFEILALPHPEEGPRHRNDLSLRKPVAWSSNPTGGTSRETIPAAARAKLTQTILPARFFSKKLFSDEARPQLRPDGDRTLQVRHRSPEVTSALPPKADKQRAPPNVRFVAVGSIGRCNTSIKSFSSGFGAQSLARPFVELPSHSVELRMRAASGSTTPPPWPPR